MSLVARLWHGLNRVTSPFGDLCCGVLFERSLVDPLPMATTSIDVALRQATEADVGEICRLYSTDPWLYLGEAHGPAGNDVAARALYIDRLRRGELCFLAISDGEIADVNWVCSTWGDALPGNPIRLNSGEVYTTDALTPERFRGKGLHAMVLRAMLEHARMRGNSQAYTLARLDRSASHKGLFQLGWRECGRIIYFLPRGRDRPWFLWRRGNLEPLFRPSGAG